MPTLVQVSDAFHGQVGDLSGFVSLVHFYVIGLVVLMTLMVFSEHILGGIMTVVDRLVIRNMRTLKISNETIRATSLDGQSQGMAFQLKVHGCPSCGHKLDYNGVDILFRNKWACKHGHSFTELKNQLGMVEFPTGKIHTFSRG